jgi:hypothetical protein
MSGAAIKTKPAVSTFAASRRTGGKFLKDSRQGVRLKAAMMQVEAALLMLQPGFKIKNIAAKRGKQV